MSSATPTAARHTFRSRKLFAPIHPGSASTGDYVDAEYFKSTDSSPLFSSAVCRLPVAVCLPLQCPARSHRNLLRIGGRFDRKGEGLRGDRGVEAAFGVEGEDDL